MSIFEKVIRLLCKHRDYSFSLAYLKHRYNLNDLELDSLLSSLREDKIAYVVEGKGKSKTVSLYADLRKKVSPHA